ALVAVLVLWRNGARWWASLTRRDRGNYANLPPVGANPVREAQLQDLAREIYTQLSGLPGFSREDVLNQANGLQDPELRYVANFYRTNVSPDGSTLKTDLQDEYFLGDIGDRLIAHLTQLAL